MLPVLFHLHLFGHDFPIYSYGMMLVITFFGATAICQWLARRQGLNSDLFVNAVLLALVTGLIGARLCDVLENLHEYVRPGAGFIENARSVLNIRSGGLTFYGGLLFATPCMIAYAIYYRVPVLVGMDIVAPAIMLGLGFGRIGCFLSGCCYGERCQLPWAIEFPYGSDAYVQQVHDQELQPPPSLLRYTARGYQMLSPNDPEVRADPKLRDLAASTRALPVQPAELYSSFTGFLLCALLVAYYTLPHRAGRVFALMLMLEGFARFVLEIVRVEPAVWTLYLHGQAYGFSISMIFGLVNIVAGAAMWRLITLFGTDAKAARVMGETAIST